MTDAGREVARRRYDGERRSSTARGYNYDWQNARKAFLEENPWCARCRRSGKWTPATVVHHSVRHNGDMDIFWDDSLWRASCAPCHDVVEQMQERRGHIVGVDARGRPIDQEHPWNTARRKGGGS